MSALVKNLEAELHAMLRRMREVPEHAVRGVIQIASSDDLAGNFYVVAGATEVEIRAGAHPSPDVKVSACTQTFLDMFTGRFAFFDPASLSRVEIDGDANLLVPLFDFFSDANQELAPFELASAARAKSSRRDAVVRVECPSEQFVREAIADYQPLIITGANLRWSWGIGAWTPEYLAQSFGDERLLVLGENATQTLATFIEEGRNGGSGKASGGMLSKRLRAAAGFPAYFDPSAYRRSFGFIGTRGSITALHRDVAHSFATCVFGRKRWTIFSPIQASLLYARHTPADGPCGESCEVDVEAPDLQRFPLYASAKPIEVDVEAGEILFVPSGWFHHVQSLELSLNVSFSLKWDKGYPGELALDAPLYDFTSGGDDGDDP